MPADRSNKASKAKAAAPAAAAPAAPAASKPSTSAAGSSKKDTKKPWSKRVQEAPQPLPKSLLSQKRKADGAAPAETQEEQETPILTGLDPSAYHSSSSEGEDSSDDDDDISDSGAIDAGIEVSKLPTIAKDDATVKRKLEKAKKSKVRALCPRRRRRLPLSALTTHSPSFPPRRSPRTRRPERSTSAASPTASTRSS